MSPQIRNFVINREKVTMARKRATVNVTGMNRDMAKGVFDPRFTFENMNIRVTARDEACTAFAVTNEKGTRLMGADVLGEPVGVFSCDSFFGIFSHDGIFQVFSFDCLIASHENGLNDVFRRATA